jgi:hypothetical protein
MLLTGKCARQESKAYLGHWDLQLITPWSILLVDLRRRVVDIQRPMLTGKCRVWLVEERRWLASCTVIRTYSLWGRYCTFRYRCTVHSSRSARVLVQL